MLFSDDKRGQMTLSMRNVHKIVGDGATSVNVDRETDSSSRIVFVDRNHFISLMYVQRIILFRDNSARTPACKSRPAIVELASD